MSFAFQRIKYAELTSRQQEAYNFQKISDRLADFGFTTIKLSSDWNGADFIAQHFDDKTFLKVQLKGRLCFYKKYQGKDLHICFCEADDWYLYPHDELLKKILDKGLMIRSSSWNVDHGYSFPRITRDLAPILALYRLPSETEG